MQHCRGQIYWIVVDQFVCIVQQMSVESPYLFFSLDVSERIHGHSGVETTLHTQIYDKIISSHFFYYSYIFDL